MLSCKMSSSNVTAHITICHFLMNKNVTIGKLPRYKRNTTIWCKKITHFGVVMQYIIIRH